MKNRNKLNFFLDIALALGFVVDMEYRFTGLAIHEALGLTVGIIMLIHLILHLDWIWQITVGFFKNPIHESRLNYLLNALLLIDGIVMVVTGIMISRTLGLNLGFGREFQSIHILSAELSLVLVGLHVAMHWKWILTHAQKYLMNFKWTKQTVALKEQQS